MERMVAHLLEVHNGALPPWLSPTQVIVLPAGSDGNGYAAKVKDQFAGHGLRAELHDRASAILIPHPPSSGERTLRPFRNTSLAEVLDSDAVLQSDLERVG